MTEENFNEIWNKEDEPALQLVDIWHLLWDHKWWYLACVLVCLAFAAFKIYRSPAIYDRYAKVIIDEGAQEAAMRDLTSLTSVSRYRYSNNVDNEVEAIGSPDLMAQVAERLGLQASYYEHQFLRTVELGPNTPVELVLAGDNPLSAFSFIVRKTGDASFELREFKIGADEIEQSPICGNLCDTISTPAGLIVLVPTLHSENWKRDITLSWTNPKALGKSLAKRVSVAISGKQTSVVVIDIKDKFPSRAENILSTLIDVYNQEWVHNKNRAARHTSAFINDRLVIIEQELGGIETDLKDYKERNKLTDIKTISNVYLQESTEYSQRSFEVENQIAIVDYIREYLKDPANTASLIPANSGLQSTSVEGQIAEYNKLVLERDKLLSTSKDGNPLVADINTSLESIRSSIFRSLDNLASTLKLQADQIRSKENAILKKIASSTGQEFQLLSIERQQKVKENLYVYLLQKREENEIASLVNVGNTRLIVSPTGSSSPVAPRTMVILVIALILGIGLPFCVFFVKKMLDFTVSTKEDLTKALSIPFLADIPEVAGRSKYQKLLHRIALDDSQRRIFVEHGKRNSINEAFRVLRTNVDMMLGQESGCKVLMFTSFYPGSGKTFVTMNLSASLALKGSKVILVDMDMRKASLSIALGGNNTGVAAYLGGKTDDLKGVITPLRENLDVVKVGAIPPNPTELLLSERCSQFFEALKAEYDYIMVDCPPVEIVADSSIITKYVDMSVFIIRAGLMDKRNLPDVEEMFASGKYTRMAMILNGVVNEAKSYGHYGYGHYGYGGYGYGGYGYGDNED